MGQGSRRGGREEDTCNTFNNNLKILMSGEIKTKYVLNFQKLSNVGAIFPTLLVFTTTLSYNNQSQNAQGYKLQRNQSESFMKTNFCQVLFTAISPVSTKEQSLKNYLWGRILLLVDKHILVTSDVRFSKLQTLETSLNIPKKLCECELCHSTASYFSTIIPLCALLRFP